MIYILLYVELAEFEFRWLKHNVLNLQVLGWFIQWHTQGVGFWSFNHSEIIYLLPKIIFKNMLAREVNGVPTGWHDGQWAAGPRFFKKKCQKSNKNRSPLLQLLKNRWYIKKYIFSGETKLFRIRISLLFKIMTGTCLRFQRERIYWEQIQFLQNRPDITLNLNQILKIIFLPCLYYLIKIKINV